MAFTVTSTRMVQATDSYVGSSPVVTVSKRIVSDTSINLLDAGQMATVRNAAFGKPLSSLMATESDTEVLGRHRLRSVQVNPVEGSQNKVFDCVARYDTMYTWAESTSSPAVTGQLILPIEVEFDMTPRQVMVYRTGSFTVQPQHNLNNSLDIGGTKVDQGGKPLMKLIPQTMVRVSFIYDTARSTDEQSLYHAHGEVDAAANTWNSAAFMFWDPNELMCETGSVTHVRDEFYRVTFVFRWDLWYGCEQVAKQDAWAKQIPDDYGSAKVVMWKSMVRPTYNVTSVFSEMYNAALSKRMAYYGHWKNPSGAVSW